MKKRLIGRVEKADFPGLALEDISIKIDTGAYTSSIHCENIVVENGILKCMFLDNEHPSYDKKMFAFNEYKSVKVKSSNGITEERYAVKSSIKLLGKTYKITLSLSDRKDMRFPVLIGRKFLSGKFIVDPQLKNLSFNA